MGQYSIKDVEKLTGIKAHTIRIWEQRYGLVKPFRTDTNIRFYDDEQLKLLINIGLLIKNGKKISHVSQMSPEVIGNELKALVQSPADKHPFYEIQIDSLIISMIELDEEKFEKIIASCTLKYGFENVMFQVVIPFLQKIGLLWATGEINVAQEHFISNLIRRKLLVAIDAQPSPKPSARKYLLFLPEDELHEIGLLFAKYIIRARGHKVIYLGQCAPLPDIASLKMIYTFDGLLTYFTVKYSAAKIQDYIVDLCRHFPKEAIWIAGPNLKELTLKLPPQVKMLEHLDELTVLLDEQKM